MEALTCDDVRGITLSPSFNHEIEEAFLRRSAPSLFGSSSTIPLPDALPEEAPVIHDDFFATPEDQYSRHPEQPHFVLHVKQETHDHYEVFQQQPPAQSEVLHQLQDSPTHHEVRFEISSPTQTSHSPPESSARATGRRQSVVDLVIEKFFPEELQKTPTSEQTGPESYSTNVQDHIALARQSSPKSVVGHPDYVTSVVMAPHPATEKPPMPTIVRRKSVSGGSKNRKSDEEVTMAARKRRKSVTDAAFPTPQPSEDSKKVESKHRTSPSSVNRLRNRRASLPVLSIVSDKGKLVDFKPALDTDDEGVRSLEEPFRSTQIQDDEGAYYGSSEDYSRESSPSEGPSRPKLELREAEVKVTRSGKRRLKWTPELSELFRRAVEKLGPSAVPSAILEEMGVKGLTRGNISSHLQKYRMETKQLQLQRQAEEEHLAHQLHAQQYPFQYGVYPPTPRYAYPGLAPTSATHPVAPEYQTSIPTTTYFPVPRSGAHLPTTSMGETSTAAEDQTELQLYLNSLGNSTERATSIDPFSSTTHELSPGPAVPPQPPHPLHQAVNSLQHSGTWPEHYGAPTPSYAFPVTNHYYQQQPYYSCSCPRPHPRSPPPISIPNSPRDESVIPLTTSTVVSLRDSMIGHSSIGLIEPAAQQS